MTEATHPADAHDLIRVHGARENNLKDVSVEIPKRRLTVFTGVSGSGKSSLVFDTIAAESQRMINETYSAFVQGFMPTLARPDVDLLDGLTTAIIVDQERMGANLRSTVGTVTDANTMLRIVFSRLGQPHVGSPQAFSFNVPSVTATGTITIEGGRKAGSAPSEGGETSHYGGTVTVEKGRTETRTFSALGGMCPRCEGTGAVKDIDIDQLVHQEKSLDDGAITVPGYTPDGWYVRVFGAVVPTDVPVKDFTAEQRHEFLYGETRKVRFENMNLTYEGLVPKVSKSMLAKDVDAMQPHIRAFVERAVTFQTCPECGGTRLAAHARECRIAGISIADACAMQISDLAQWVRGLSDPGVAPLLANLGRLLDGFVEIGLGYLSLDRSSGTLSGGEAQRTKMIRHLGSSLTDVTYVFDEPSVGLHPHDTQRMNRLLERLRDKGNTVLVVEHKPEVIAIA
ncbi:MAG TPA: excinuclease ABC subunit UvrA, partial [Actinotalea sp.]|nr:excinuclease ABC subunit UvrA [Actinotalea sp.]